ncbi:hypothetical protein GJ496_011364 [Pomphorhynchus laevis]|nr:hypothetical protein GJ496_011364 [Pomphorhynchus laevis]
MAHALTNPAVIIVIAQSDGKKGSCINKNGSYECCCSPGWNGTNCDQDIDECAIANICENNGTCTNKPGGYNCNCTRGWQGQNCTDDINECISNETICHNNGTCINTMGGYNCSCAKG